MVSRAYLIYKESGVARCSAALTLTLLPLLVAALIICRAATAAPAKDAKKTELMVFAAVSLKDVFEQLALEFEKRHPGVRVYFNFAASGDLQKQIEQGADADVFASASETEMQALTAEHEINRRDVRQLARNELVIVSAKQCPCLSDAHELLKLKRVAIGDPKYVPVGRYAQIALTKIGIYSELMDKQKLLLAHSARQVLTYVEMADVDAGIVYRSEALSSRGRVRVGIALPESLTGPIAYPIASLARTKHHDLATAFIDFALCKQSQAVFQARGFSSRSGAT